MAISVSGQRSHTRSIHRIPKLSSNSNTPAPIRISASAVTPDPEFEELEQVVIGLTPVWIVGQAGGGFIPHSANGARLPASGEQNRGRGMQAPVIAAFTHTLAAVNDCSLALDVESGLVKGSIQQP